MCRNILCAFIWSAEEVTIFLSQIISLFLSLLSRMNLGIPRYVTLIVRDGVQVLFLGTFAKLRKATFSFLMSVRLYGTTRLQLDGF
jgi:hypothetical protein